MTLMRLSGAMADNVYLFILEMQIALFSSRLRIVKNGDLCVLGSLYRSSLYIMGK